MYSWIVHSGIVDIQEKISVRNHKTYPGGTDPFYGSHCSVIVYPSVAGFIVCAGCTTAGSKTITVEVVHKNASTKTFTYQTDEEYLGAVLLEESLVKGSMGEYGLYITEVDGEVADYAVDKSYWALYEGEEYAMQGADTTPIADGDNFSLVYTIG